MTNRSRKKKRRDRGSTEGHQSSPKRANMAENLAEEELDETPWSNPAAAEANPTEPTRAEL